MRFQGDASSHAWLLTLVTECKAEAKDMDVYYHPTVLPGGAYVVDTSEKVGYKGNKAHFCLLRKFRATLRDNLGCMVTEMDDSPS